MTDFGQLSSPSGSSQSMFGQQNTSSNNLFVAKSFGSPTPFGSETGNSMSRGTATGVFGTAQTLSPFSSNTDFGASSSTSAFGKKSSSSYGRFFYDILFILSCDVWESQYFIEVKYHRAFFSNEVCVNSCVSISAISCLWIRSSLCWYHWITDYIKAKICIS